VISDHGRQSFEIGWIRNSGVHDDQGGTYGSARLDDDLGFALAGSAFDQDLDLILEGGNEQFEEVGRFHSWGCWLEWIVMAGEF
jgi:hypothetical protein